MSVTIRPARNEDAEALRDLVTRNRDFFRTGGPLRADKYYTLRYQRQVIANATAARAADTSAMFVIEADARIVGRANINSIIRGAFQSASVGYVVDEAHTGRGIATSALQLLIACAFEELGLHRLQGEVSPTNAASKQVLTRCGFVQYGTAPDYLCIQGQWQTHDLFQLINPSYSG